MTFPEIQHKPPDPEAGRTGYMGHTGLDALRAVYNAIDDTEAQTKVFDVEGSFAAVRYRRMRLEDREKIGSDVLGNDGKRLDVNAQFLIEACEEILLHDPETGEIGPVIPGEKVTFDYRPGESIPLHQALGEPESDIRRSVLRLFQGVDDAVMNHAERVETWMGTVQDLTRERFSGG